MEHENPPGIRFAGEPGVNSLDRQRGKLPEIQTDEDTITFVMAIQLRPDSSPLLVVRCHRDGEIYMSICPSEDKRRG